MRNSILFGIAAVAVGAVVIGLGGKKEKPSDKPSTYSPYEKR